MESRAYHADIYDSLAKQMFLELIRIKPELLDIAMANKESMLTAEEKIGACISGRLDVFKDDIMRQVEVTIEARNIINPNN